MKGLRRFPNELRIVIQAGRPSPISGKEAKSGFDSWVWLVIQAGKFSFKVKFY
jgi:hypothetical protein